MTTHDRARKLALRWMNPATESPRVLDEVTALLDLLVEAREYIGTKPCTHEEYLRVKPLIAKIDKIVEGK